MYVCMYTCSSLLALCVHIYIYIDEARESEREREGEGEGEREREYSIAQMLVNCEYDSEWFKGCAGFYRTLEDSVRVV